MEYNNYKLCLPLLGVVLIFCAIIYLFGLQGEFYFDDTHNILKNQGLQISTLSWDELLSAWHSGSAGPLKRPVAMLSFGIDYYLYGFDPFYFKLTNLVIHLLNGVGLFILCKLLISNLPTSSSNPYPLLKHLPLLLTTLWLLHPLNLSPVLYVVQRMASLSALFCIWGMASYTLGRKFINEKNAIGYLFILASLFVFLPLAAFSKENGLLLPFYLLLIEWLFFRFSLPEKQQKFGLYILFLLICATPALICLLYFFIQPEWLIRGYANREFSLNERVLTQFRALVFYLKMIILPNNAELGLFHDDFTVSRSLLSPITTLYSIALILILVLFALLKNKKLPVASFGILFFFIAHSMESSIVALELVHEHRNYLADFGILFTISYFILTKPPKYLSPPLFYFFIIVIVIFFGTSTLIRSSTWGDKYQHAITEVQNHPNSPRANYRIGKLYASIAHNVFSEKDREKNIAQAIFYFKKSAELNPNYTDGLFGLVTLHGIEGIPFDKEAFEMLLYRLENQFFLANNYNAIGTLIHCVNKKVCTIDSQIIDSIILASKQNKFFLGRSKKNILNLYEEYQKQLTASK